MSHLKTSFLKRSRTTKQITLLEIERKVSSQSAIMNTLPADFKKILGFSDFIVKFCNKNPERLNDLLKSNDLETQYTQNIYNDRLKKEVPLIPDENRLNTFLRQFHLFHILMTHVSTLKKENATSAEVYVRLVQ